MSTNHLSTLFSEHRGKVSDKWAIYIAEYERLFAPYAHQAINLLEIGIQNGGSLEIWAKYFTQATHIIGCDINPACQQLTFNDERIHVVVINANTDEAEQKIKSHATNFDLIIDDGSHQSGDIVCSFERYFPLVKSGGLYIAEDLHCSYWQDFQGGLYQPYSSIEFFKHLADIVNHEHWGVEKTRSELLTNFNEQYQSAMDEHSLAEIHSVEFVNSLCIVRKLNASANSLGLRVVSGETALVCADVLPLNGSPIPQPNQQHNNWAQHSALALEKADHRQDNENSTQQWQALKTQLTDEQQRYQHLKETNQQQINALQAELNEQLKAQLQREQAYQNHTNALLTQRNDEIKTLEHTYFEQRQQTQKAQAEHEWLTSERIHTLSERLQTTQTELAQRDKQLAAQAYEFTNTLVEAKKHIELLLAEKNEGSEAVAQQYAELTAHYEQAKANLTAHYQAQLTTLQAQHAEHEWLANERMHILQERLHAAQTHTQERETVHAEREHATANQLQALQNQLNTAFAQYVKAEATHTQLIEQTKQQAAHEANKQSAQHTAHLDELKQTLANQRQKEQDRVQQHHTQIQQLVAEHTNAEQMHQAQVAALHREMETRQQEQLNQQAEYKAQLEAQHRALVAQANEQINELTLSHKAQVQALQSQLNAAQLVFKEQEQSLAAQMHASQQQAEADIRALRQQHQTQLEAMQQQHAAQERHLKAQCQAKQDELTQLGQGWSDTQQVHTQSMKRLEQQLQTMRATYTWRWTAPLRTFAQLFIKRDASLQEDLHDYNDRVPHTPRLMQDGTVTNRLQSSPQVDIHYQDTMTNSAPTSGLNMSTNLAPSVAQSIDELLSYYDEEFVHCAYHTLLGRAPDKEGMDYYLSRVRAGISRFEIIAQLLLSSEAKKNNKEKIKGLRFFIFFYRARRIPLIGNILFLAGMPRKITETSKNLNLIVNSQYLNEKKIRDDIASIYVILKKIQDKQNELPSLNIAERSAAQNVCNFEKKYLPVGKGLNLMIFDSFSPTKNSYIIRAILHEAKLVKDVNKVYLANYNNAFKLLKDNDIDVLIVLGGVGVESHFIKKLSESIPVSILWTTEDPYELSGNVELSKIFDLVYTNDKNSKGSYLQKKGRFLPLASSKKYQYHEVLKDDEAFVYDILFIGTAWPNRVKTINELIENLPKKLKFKVALSSNIFLPEFKMSHVDFYKWRVANSEFSKLVNRSRIVITLGREFSSSENPSQSSSPPPRIFEQALAGGFQLVNKSDFTFNDIFKDGKEVISFNGIEDLIHKIDFFLKNPKERISIAENAQKLVVNKHMYRHRLEQILADARHFSLDISKVNTNKKRVLFVSHNVLSHRSGGGVEIYQDYLSKHIEFSNRWEVFILYPKDKHSWAVIDSNTKNEFNYNVLNSMSTKELSNHVNERVFEEVLLNFKIDVVHFQHLLGFPLSLPLISKSLGIPSIFTFHDYYSICNEFNLIGHDRNYCNINKETPSKCQACSLGLGFDANSQIRRRNFMAIVMNSFESIVFNSDFTLNYCKDIFVLDNKKLKIIEMMTPVILSSPLNKNKYLTDCSTLNVVILGNFTRQKGGDTLVEIFKILDEIDIKFTILGRVDSEYKLILDALFLKNVHCHGAYQQDQVADLLGKFDVGLFLPIWPESYMISLNEAMLSGVVPFVTNIGAPAERIIHGYNGFVFEVGAVNEVVNKLISIYKDKTSLIPLSINCSKTVYNTVEKHSESILALYDQILSFTPIQYNKDYCEVDNHFELDLDKLHIRVNHPRWDSTEILLDSAMGVQNES